jgi:hypothetical protein
MDRRRAEADDTGGAAVKAWRLLAGLFLGGSLVLAVWATGLVLPPESVARRVAAWSAVYPGPVGEAEVDPIECAPLQRVRIYLVCTDECRGVRRLVAVRGLVVTPLANLNRIPPEDLKVTRGRINAVITGERLRLDIEGAREMIGCFMRIEGLEPALVLSEGGLEDVTTARASGEEAMRRLEESFDDPQPLARVAFEEWPDGFQAVFLYWDTSRAGAPVLRLTIDMSGAGELRAMRAIQVVPLAPRPGAASEPGGAAEPGASAGPGAAAGADRPGPP